MGSKKKTKKTPSGRPAKKTPVKKAPVKKAPGKKAPVRKAPAKKSPAKKLPVKTGASRKPAPRGKVRSGGQTPGRKVVLPSKRPGTKRATSPRPRGQKPTPEPSRSVTVRLCVVGADAAIGFYTLAFDATEVYRIEGKDGEVLHAMLRIGDSVVHLQDEIKADTTLQSPQALVGASASIDLYVPDVDATFARSLAAGAESTQGVEDTFWGDRAGTITDPFGHVWTIATRVYDMTPSEIQAAAAAFFASAEIPATEEEPQPDLHLV